MSTDPYAQARQIVNAAQSAPFTLQPYTGGTSDLNYLRNWVVSQASTIYNVDPSIFDTSTVLSTSILRDFVHRALYDTTLNDNLSTVVNSPGFLGWNDVGMEFRYPIHGLCSEMARQELCVFRALGFQTDEISTVDGAVGSYGDSHCTTQVYVSDLGKYIIQDATFNFLYRDGSGNILSFNEARQHNQLGDLVFDGFKNYRSYNTALAPEPYIDTSLQNYFKAHYLKDVYWLVDANGNQTLLLPSLFLTTTGAHDPNTWQGGEFATRAAAAAAVSSLAGQGLGWTDGAAALRAQGYYVSGFALGSTATQVATQWYTLRLADGSYVSFDRVNGTQLNGAFDQLQDEATGGVVLNPGVNLSSILTATSVLSVSGAVLDTGLSLPIPTDVLGTSGADVLIGTPGIDRLIGWDGNDTLDGRGGADYLVGGKGDDSYYVYTGKERLVENPGEGTDTVYSYVDYTMPANFEILNLVGSAVNGTINTGEGWIYGNSNNNIFYAYAGSIGHLYGGTGNDVYYIYDPRDTVVENPGEGSNDWVYAYCDYSLPANVEVMVLRGAAVSGTINNGGTGTIYGNNSNNLLYAYAGSIAALYGGMGNDAYYVYDPKDTIVELSGQGTDWVYAYCNYTMPANVEVMVLRGSALKGSIGTGEGWIYGNNNGDTLDSRGAIGHLYGGTGNDTFYVSNAASTVVEQPGGGTDTVNASCDYTMPANVEVMNLLGAAKKGTINSGEATIYGNNNGDILTALGAIGHLYGGSGNDNYYVDNPGSTIVEQPGGGIDTVYAYCDYIMPANVEIMNLKGSAVRGTVSSGQGWIYGNNNGDILDSRGALGHLYGGTGNDTFYVDNAATTVVEQPGGGTDTINASCNFVMPANVEVMNLLGAATKGTISSGEGSIYGNNNGDTLNALGGIGHLYGGSGNDNYYVDNPSSTIVEQPGGGVDTVYAYCDYIMPANVEIMNLKASAVRGTVSSGQGWIYGNNNGDVLDSRGALGHLYGGTGNDTFYVDNAATTVVEQPGGGNDTIDTSVSYALQAGSEVETLQVTDPASTTALNLTGNAFANTLTGNAGNNLLNGLGGSDTMTGGSGNDTFVLNSPQWTETVTDFASGTDQFRLDHLGFGITGTGSLASTGVGFVTGTTATSAAPSLLYDNATGSLYWDADGTGSGASTQIAHITDLPHLTATDFFVA